MKPPNEYREMWSELKDYLHECIEINKKYSKELRGKDSMAGYVTECKTQNLEYVLFNMQNLEKQHGIEMETDNEKT